VSKLNINWKLSVTVIVVIVMLFLFKMIFLNQVARASDTVARQPISNWSAEYVQEHNDMPFWSPIIFSGMPTNGSYLISNYGPLNTFILKLINKGVTYGIFFIIAGLGVYRLLKKLNMTELVALFGGIVYAVTPYQFGLINAGHGAKLISLVYFPWILLAAYNLFFHQKRINLIWLALMTALQLWANHPQMVYYTWMVVIFFWLWNLVADRISNTQTVRQGTIASLMLVGGLILAFVLVSDPYVSVYEFQEHSNRGASSVLDKSGATDSGVQWDYATQWSFQPKELISFIYPYYFGMQNYPTRDIKSAAYWGGMPFTQSTHYFGILVVLIAILGAVLNRPDRFQTFLWVTSGLILLVGFGNYIPLLYGPLFKLAPFFSKFRVPSMIYALLPFTFGVLAAFGLDNILKLIKEDSAINRKVIKKVVIIFGGFIGLTLIYLLFGGSLVNFFKPGEANQYDPRIIPQIKAVRMDLFQKGIILALAISTGGFAAIWLGIKQKVKPQFVGIAIIALTVVDLWVVDNEFLYLKNARQMEQQFQPNKITEFLTADTDLFRIFPVDELNTNWYGYFGLASIGGYRPVKLRNYQDLMDAGGFNNVSVLNMLNVKYLITAKNITHPSMRLALPGGKRVFENTAVLPKAWIVNRVTKVTDQKESLQKVLTKEFSPESEAIVINFKNEDITPTGGGEVVVNEYSDNEIELSVTSNGNGLLVLSEIYYKPGWLASVDGIETTIYQTNHVLRSVVVPDGKHTVRFFYNDHKWKITRLLSRLSLAFTLLAIAYIYRVQIVGLIKRKQ